MSSLTHKELETTEIDKQHTNEDEDHDSNHQDKSEAERRDNTLPCRDPSSRVKRRETVMYAIVSCRMSVINVLSREHE